MAGAMALEEPTEPMSSSSRQFPSSSPILRISDPRPSGKEGPYTLTLERRDTSLARIDTDPACGRPGRFPKRRKVLMWSRHRVRQSTSKSGATAIDDAPYVSPTCAGDPDEGKLSPGKTRKTEQKEKSEHPLPHQGIRLS